MSTKATPATAVDPRTQDTSDLWRRAVVRVLQGDSPLEAAVWNEPVDILRVLTSLVNTHATTLCAETQRFRLKGVSAGQHGPASLSLTLGEVEQAFELEAERLDYVPHPKSAAHSAFVLSLTAVNGGSTQRRVVLAHDNGLVIPMLTIMGYSNDPDTLGGAFARGEVNREGYGPDDPAESLLPAEEDDPIAAAFEAHRQGRTGTLDQSDVDVIAWAALEAGLQPTLELIRRYAGGGSNTTIHPRLKDFYGRLVKERLKGTQVSPVLKKLWSQLQASAAKEVDEKMTPQREALQLAEQGVAEERIRLRDAQEALANERAALQTADQARQTFIASLEARLTVATEQLAAANHTIAGDADQLAEARTELRHACARTEELETILAERTQQLETARTNVAKTSAAHDRLAAEHHAALKTTAELEQRLQQAAEELRQSKACAAEAIQHAERLTARLADLEAKRVTDEEALSLASARTEALIAGYATMKESLAGARSKMEEYRERTDALLDTTREQLVETTAQLGKRESELAHVRAAHEAVVRERDRLDGLLARLNPARND